MNARTRRLDGLAILLLLGATALFFSHILFFGRQFYLRDLTRYYYPTKRIVRELLLGGHFPWWNPYYGAGQPMAANPEYEVFYPLQWLILLPSYNFGYSLHIILHIPVAAIGMYCLLRSLSLRIPAALFGALTFGFGGFLLSQVNLLPILFCAAWIPWILLFARRHLLSGSWRDFALASLFLGLQVLTAEPTTLLQTWFLLGCYLLYRAWYAERRLDTLARGALSLAGMVVAGLAVGSVQFFPAIDHVRDSARARPFDFGLVTTWSMPWPKPLELLFPNLFGHTNYQGAMWYWAGGLYPGIGSPFVFSEYLGLFAIALVLAAIFVRPRGGRLVLGLCAFSMLIALGGNTPLFKWLYDAHLLRSIRYPEKFSMLAIVALTIFSAVLLDRVLRGDRRLARTVSLVAAGVASFSFVVSAFAWSPWFSSVVGTMWGISRNPILPTIVTLSRHDWLLVLARAILVFCLAWVATWKLPGRLWSALLLLFVFADLAYVGIELIPTMPRAYFTQPEAVGDLAPDKQNYRVFHEMDWYGGGETAKKYFSTGKSVYWIVRNGVFPMTTATWGVRSVLERDYDKTELLPTIDLVAAMWDLRDAGNKDWARILMAMSNARYRTEYRDFDDEKKRIDGNFDRARPIDFLPVEGNERYYFADEMAQAADRRSFVRALKRGKFSPRVAFVPFVPFPPAAGIVRRVDEKPDRISLDVTAEGRSLLVASVTRHRYWSATVDGRPATLQPVNLAYQGLLLGPGPHRVEMRYRNPVVAACLPISAGAAALLLIVAVVAPSRRVPNALHDFDIEDDEPDDEPELD